MIQHQVPGSRTASYEERMHADKTFCTRLLKAVIDKDLAESKIKRIFRLGKRYYTNCAGGWTGS
jgi:hypothetical protein